MSASKQIDIAKDVEVIKDYLHRLQAEPTPSALENRTELASLAAKVDEISAYLFAQVHISSPKQTELARRYELVPGEDIQLIAEPPLRVSKVGDSWVMSVDLPDITDILAPTEASDSSDASVIEFGKPTAAFSSGATITLDPCDVHGTDNGEANVTVYVQASRASYSMTNSTTIPTTQIVPYVYGDDGNAYMLGTPIEVVTTYQVVGATRKFQKKTRNVWVTPGGESGWVDVHTGDACP